MKPQMTPEQQTAYRQAVAQKVIDSIPYEKYCAITPEQAAKQIKAWEKSKAVDFNQPLSNRRNAPAPERAAPASVLICESSGKPRASSCAAKRSG